MAHGSRRRAKAGAAAVLLAALPPWVVACGDDDASSDDPEAVYYVSLGDSYSVGAQVTREGVVGTENGYADQVVDMARERGVELTLRNFGCGGATSASILENEECRNPAVDGPSWRGRSQGAAAERFIADHPGQIGLVTVSIGGNDIIACAGNDTVDDVIACAEDAIAEIEENLETLLDRLRTAAGDDVLIVGLTYPNVFLAMWLQPGGRRQIATYSVDYFRSMFNPALEAQYEAVGGRFVDVTAATGAYEPLSETTTTESFGDLPEAVARLCELTYACDLGDVHATTEGYRVIADLILEELPPA